jgi:EAL and modified HD-GYP domain-containing signal transduction protein
VDRLKELKEMGYGLAIRKLPVQDFENYREILKLMDYVFLNNKKIAIDKAKIYFGNLYPDIRLCAGGIDTMETFETLKEIGGYDLYEGDFYRVPVTKGDHEVAPLKVNYIELLNVVNDENFELADAADIIGRDTALTISLLQMVNRMTVNAGITTIRHAAAMLGQRELRKWINTALVHKLYADKPSEITRISLLRAKFAEFLAPSFGLKPKEDELFLMGLFSVLDVILEKPMEEALQMVMVTGEVREALLYHTGALAPVLDLTKQYESANWAEVSRQLLLRKMDADTVSQAYQKALMWYRDLM